MGRATTCGCSPGEGVVYQSRERPSNGIVSTYTSSKFGADLRSEVTELQRAALQTAPDDFSDILRPRRIRGESSIPSTPVNRISGPAIGIAVARYSSVRDVTTSLWPRHYIIDLCDSKAPQIVVSSSSPSSRGIVQPCSSSIRARLTLFGPSTSPDSPLRAVVNHRTADFSNVSSTGFHDASGNMIGTASPEPDRKPVPDKPAGRIVFQAPGRPSTRSRPVGTQARMFAKLLFGS